MRKVIFFVAAMFVSMAAYSQTSGRVPFEIRRSVLFADGRLDEYTISDWNDPAFTRINKETRHSPSGAMLEQVNFYYNEDKGWLTSKITMNPFDNSRKGGIEYTYDPRNNLLLRERINDAKNRPLSFNDYTYDEGVRRSRIIKDRSGVKLAETIYTYDSSFKLIRSETRDQKESTISSTRYLYDSQGNKIKEEVVNGEGAITSITTFVWQDGREIMSEMTAPDGKVLLRISNEYGANGELIKKIIENFQGESKQILQYEYTYRPVRR